MRRALGVILVLLMLPTMSSAEMSAARLSTDLDLVDSPDVAPEQGMRFLLAAGYVQGAGEMGNQMLFCLPPNYTQYSASRIGPDAASSGSRERSRASGRLGQRSAEECLDDPIFNGLAVSLIFGILVSTLLTLVVIPVLYYTAKWRKTP